MNAQRTRTAANQETIRREVSYFRDHREHREHLHYKTTEKAGAPLGSGAVESLGKQFQARLRGCGQMIPTFGTDFYRQLH